MAINTVKDPQREQKSGKKPAAGGSIFSLIERSFQAGKIFEEGVPVKYLPHILWVSFLVILYIANAHYTEKTTRKIDRLKSDVEDLRADFTTLKADYMYASKQSEVARKVETMGLKESKVPPVKVSSEDK